MGAGDTDKRARPNDQSNTTMTVEKITIADSAGQGADKECRKCMIIASGTAYVAQSAALAAADGGALLSQTVLGDFPVANTNMLFFKGTNAEFIYLISFL